MKHDLMLGAKRALSIVHRRAAGHAEAGGAVARMRRWDPRSGLIPRDSRLWLWRAGARALLGAPGERREVADQPAGSPARMQARISTGQGWPFRNPRLPHANPWCMDAPRART